MKQWYPQVSNSLVNCWKKKKEKKRKPAKKLRIERDSNQCLPTELRSHTLGAGHVLAACSFLRRNLSWDSFDLRPQVKWNLFHEKLWQNFFLAMLQTQTIFPTLVSIESLFNSKLSCNYFSQRGKVRFSITNYQFKLKLLRTIPILTSYTQDKLS